MYEKIISQLAAIASEEKADILRRFFKTGKGEYGEGDVFIGVTVPQTRAIARGNIDTTDYDIARLLDSPVHEHRLCGLLIHVEQFRRARRSPARRREIVEFYLSHARRANNWDLVDLSAPKIIGEWLIDNPDPAMLDRLSHSDCIWEQRIAIVATLTLIRATRFDDTLRLAKRYLTHPHPLMHKATGWMLREIGKKDPATLTDFLDRHAARMPRTALRYAIEKLSPDQRLYYMKKKS